MEGKRGSECLLKPVSNIDFNPVSQGHPMVTSKNLTHSGLDMTDVSFLTDEDFNEINKRSKVSIGDILFGMIGTIGNPVIVDRDDFAIKNVALIKEKTSNSITNKWLLQYLKSPSFNRFIQKENAGGTQKFIALGLIRDMKLRVPEFDEQQKIGSFFKQLDNTITLHQRKLAKLKELKQGYLQKLFPENGSKFPQLRFAGFADAWEDRKFFESIASTIDFRGRTPKKLGMDWSESGYLALSALNVKNGYIDPLADAHYGDENLYKKWMSGKELKKGQVLFTTEAPMGNVAQVPDNNGYILSQRTVAFETKEDMMTNDFLAVLLKSPLVFNNLSALSSGGTAKGVSQKSLKGLSITVPFDIDEQQKIGSFFKQLDDTIALHQRKLDLLKEQKKGFLQKMFV